VLALVALGALAIVPFLLQMANGTRAVTIVRTARTDNYSAGSGIEHARWRLQFEAGFADSINEGFPVYAYEYTINNKPVYITITWVPPLPPPGPPPGGGPQSDRVSVEYEIIPSELMAGQPVVVTVVISVRNIGTSKIKFEEMGDKLPQNFTYEAGSAYGLTSSEPLTQMVSGRQEMTWEWGSPHPEIDPEQLIQQMFQASAIPPEGVYYNEAWVEFVPDAVGTVSSGGGDALVAQYRKYDVISRAGNVTLRSRLGMNDLGVIVQSWQQ